MAQVAFQWRHQRFRFNGGDERDGCEAMIRKHYAASILDFTDEITRKTLPTLGPTMPPAASNVVKLTKR